MRSEAARTATTLLGAIGSCLLASCIAPAPPVERATDAARELNLATRFGRMDVAMMRTHAAERDEFMKRHSAWGTHLRVLDVELAGLEMKERNLATVYVDVSWVRVDESILRTTRLAQTWTDQEGSWQLTDEAPVLGDDSLFAKTVDHLQGQRPDVHLPTKTIR